MRNGFKKGDWLVIDEESGLTEYASKVVKDAYYKYVNKNYADPKHPSEFVRNSTNDPHPLPFTSLPDRDFEVTVLLPDFVGNTTIPSPTNGAASHLYITPGIGQMAVGSTFIIR